MRNSCQGNLGKHSKMRQSEGKWVPQFSVKSSLNVLSVEQIHFGRQQSGDIWSIAGARPRPRRLREIPSTPSTCDTARLSKRQKLQRAWAGLSRGGGPVRKLEFNREWVTAPSGCRTPPFYFCTWPHQRGLAGRQTGSRKPVTATMA